jgi:hypothetical protein
MAEVELTGPQCNELLACFLQRWKLCGFEAYRLLANDIAQFIEATVVF